MRKHFPLDPVTGVENAALLPWTNGVPSTGVDGSYPPYQLCVDPETEILNAQAASGLSPSGTDGTQLAQAISTGVFLGVFGGTANALTATLPGSLTVPALTVGMTFHGIVGLNPNTSAATLTLSGFTAVPGTQPIVKRNGTSALVGGDLQASAIVSFRWDGTSFRYIGTTDSDVLALIAANAIVPTPGASTQKVSRLVGFTASFQNQTFSTSTNTQLSLTISKNNLYGTSTFTSNSLTIGPDEAGIWDFTGFSQFQSGSSGLNFTSVSLRQNGAQVAIGGDNCGSGLSSYNNFAQPIVTAVGDVFTWFGYQQSGSVVNAPNQAVSAFLISSYAV